MLLERDIVSIIESWWLKILPSNIVNYKRQWENGKMDFGEPKEKK